MAHTRPRAALLLLLLSTLLSLALGGVPGAHAAPALQTSHATLRVVVFSTEGSAPLAGVEVRALGRSVWTGPRGAAVLRVSGDATRITLTLVTREGQLHHRPDVRVATGMETEVLATLPGPAAPSPARFAVEAPRALAAAATETSAAAGPPGEVQGTVVDIRGGRALAAARIYVRGSDTEATSDARGRFSLRLPAGTWDLMVVRQGFAPQQVRAVTVRAGAVVARRVGLSPAGVELAGFVVSAPRIVGNTASLLEGRRRASAVADVLGAEQMARAGDSDAAGALARVTGVTLVGGRFVYVRGLGERYSATQLDGATLPSPEPERRVVPLDLFPVSVLERIVVQKTWSPDRPAQFGGGAVDLHTRAFPKGFTAKVGFSAGLRLGTSLREGPRSREGNTDWLGIDDGTRALDPTVAAASAKAPLLEADMFAQMIGSGGYGAAELERFGERARGDWQVRRARTPLDLGMSAHVGDTWRLLGGTGGWLLALNWGSGWQRQERLLDILTVGAGGVTERAHSYRFDGLSREVNLGGMLTAGLDFGERHQLRLTVLLGRMSEGEVRTYQGYNRDVGAEIRVTRHRWIERMLQTTMLRGRHQLPLRAASGLGRAQLSWRYGLSLATRQEPDRRSIRYDNEPGTDTWLLSDRPEGNRRTFSALSDLNHDLGLDLTLPLGDVPSRGGGAPMPRQLKLGLLGALKDRVVDTRRYRFLHKGPRSRDPALLSQPPEYVFTPETIGSDGFQLSETTLESDNYTGAFRLGALYGLVEWPLSPSWRVAGGLRLESALLRMGTFVPFDPDATPVRADLPGTDLLGGASVTWQYTDKQQLRAALSRTVSRPDLRELSPATFNEVTGGRLVFGNPELERARITHADLRWEWFPARGQVLSVSGFYKHFARPVETIVVPSAQLSVTFANARAAHDLGVELEWRGKLGWLAPQLADAYVAGNAAWIWSRITLPSGGQTIQTSKVRPLQGQSPWVLNLQAGWERPESGTRVGLLYNAAGPRITEVGALGAPDVYDEPVHRLDLVASQRLPGAFSLGVKLQNLLDAAITRTQGGQVIDRWSKGGRVGVSLSRGW